MAAGTFRHADVEHLVHPGVERVRLEDVAELVDHVENDLVDLRMQGAVALAVQAVRVRPLGIVLRLDGRGFVEFGILPEQGVRLLGPGLSTAYSSRPKSASTLFVPKVNLMPRSFARRMMSKLGIP